MSLWKLDFAPSKAMKMQVILLNWCGSNKTCKGRSGIFHVYGGHDLRSPQYLTVDFSFTLHYFLSSIIDCNNVLVSFYTSFFRSLNMQVFAVKSLELLSSFFQEVVVACVESGQPSQRF
jgi:hypothetical protein